jgi:hypothetical protein
MARHRLIKLQRKLSFLPSLFIFSLLYNVYSFVFLLTQNSFEGFTYLLLRPMKVAF